MPAALNYLDPNSKLRDDVSGILSSSERRKRNGDYTTARDYYEGKHKRHLDKKEGEPDDNIIVNITRMAVDRTMSFLFPTMPILELDPEETEETAEEKWLRKAWEFNEGVVFLQDVALNGCLAGHSYVRVLPPEREGEFPQLVNVDPTSIITYWKADNIKKVMWHELYWFTEDGSGHKIEYILDIINDENNDRWFLVQYSRMGGGQWEIDPENTQVWGFRWGPIVQWKHLPNPNRFYGKAETDHLDLNDKLNLIVSENARINRYHSSPKTIAIGIAPDEIKETAIDDLWSTENDKAQVFNLEMKSDQAFSQHLMAFLYDSYLAESRVVLLRGEVKDFQRVTNAGVRTVFMDMLSKNTVLRQQYGTAIQQISQRMLMLGGFGEDLVPDVIHIDPLPTDDKELVDIAAIERSMGIVSRQTVSEKRGYTWSDELKRQVEEGELEIFKVPVPKPGGGAGGLAGKQENAKPNAGAKTNSE